MGYLEEYEWILLNEIAYNISFTFLRFTDGRYRLYGLAAYVSCSFQLGGDFCDFQWIAVKFNVTSVRTSRALHTY